MNYQCYFWKEITQTTINVDQKQRWPKADVEAREISKMKVFVKKVTYFDKKTLLDVWHASADKIKKSVRKY